MIKWLRSLLGTSDPVAAGAPPAQAREAPSNDRAELEHGDVLVELRQWVSGNSPRKLAVEQIDCEVHMYDAGYVDSLKGADLLVHIEKRYELFIHETDLVGNLASLDALAKHIVAKRKEES